MWVTIPPAPLQVPSNAALDDRAMHGHVSRTNACARRCPGQLVRRGNEEAAGYIELFLASTEFSSFVWLMRHVLAEQQRDAANAKRAAESSESKGDDWAKARDAPDEDGGRGPARVAEMDDIAGGAGDSSETTDSARRKK